MVLFNRVKSCTVVELNEELMEARGSFIDSIHEINLGVRVTKSDLEIVWAKADMVRIPHPGCAEAKGRDLNLVGIKIGKGTSKLIQAAVGGSDGCTHLADLAMDVVRALVQAKYKLDRTGITQEEFIEKQLNHLAGTCIQWTQFSEQSKAAVKGVAK